MALTFYYGSGSPFAWKVWLVLEHKELSVEHRLLSFRAGDTRTPEYRELSPRGKVPALVDGSFSLYESSAIVEYLEDTHPDPPVLPRAPAARAVARRIAAEVDAYLYPPVYALMRQTLFEPEGHGDPRKIVAATKTLLPELDRFEGYLGGDHFAGDAVSIADFAVYPVLAMLRRINDHHPAHAVPIPRRLDAWMRRIEALPYFERTIPPHWKETNGPPGRAAASTTLEYWLRRAADRARRGRERIARLTGKD